MNKVEFYKKNTTVYVFDNMEIVEYKIRTPKIIITDDESDIAYVMTDNSTWHSSKIFASADDLKTAILSKFE